MQRFGSVLRLREGAAEEYARYHENPWPEVMEVIQKAGFVSYTIFLYDQWLFSYAELPDEIAAEDAIGMITSNETWRRWDAIMHTLQEPLPESGEILWWVPMQELWRLPEKTD